jgi:subtilisin family serine protease
LCDKWFDHIQRVSTDVRARRKDDDIRIKIAILDTGIDETHQQVKAALNPNSPTIVGCKGFPDYLLPLRDQNGHGTYGASLILKVAPDVDLFIARVSDDNGIIIEDNDFKGVVEVQFPDFNC